jgi:hypothetical protein
MFVGSRCIDTEVALEVISIYLVKGKQYFVVLCDIKSLL